MRDSENIKELINLTPTYIGFIFYDQSKRFVADFPEVNIPKAIKKVGVFVNETIEKVVEKVEKHQLEAIQLHGDESVAYCEKLCSLSGVEVNQKSDMISTPLNHQFQIIKAFAVDEHFDFSNTQEYESSCDLFLFDTKGKEYGGNGLKYDWSILKKYNGDTPFLLSGGINENDVEAILSFLQRQESNRCIGLDLNSGFEDAPSEKNIEKLKTFMSFLRKQESHD